MKVPATTWQKSWLNGQLSRVNFMLKLRS